MYNYFIVDSSNDDKENQNQSESFVPDSTSSSEEKVSEACFHVVYLS